MSATGGIYPRVGKAAKAKPAKAAKAPAEPAPAKKSIMRGPASWDRFQLEIQDAAVVIVNKYDEEIGKLGVFESASELEVSREAAVLALHELAKRLGLSITEGANQFGPEAWIRKYIERVRKEERLRK